MSAWILRNARPTLFSLLGLLVAFAMAAGTAKAQHRGFSRGGHHATGHGGGAGFGGWVHGNTSSFYTFNHNRGGHQAAGGHRHGGSQYHRGGAAAAFPQPYYPYLPFLNYGFTSDLNSDLNFDDGAENNGPEYVPPQPNPGEAAMQMNQAAMANQLRALHAELEDLKAAEAAAPPPAPSYAPQVSETGQPQPPVTLVLRNGQRLTVNDYAVMDQTFWDFSEQPVYKIPLSSIDMEASQRATTAAGGEFPALPASQ